MPASDATVAVDDGMNPTVERNGDTLLFRGALLRAAVAGLWKPALAGLGGVRRFDLHAVTRVDSAGLAMLAELASRVPGVAIDGTPPGLPELRGAYRLDPGLRHAA